MENTTIADEATRIGSNGHNERLVRPDPGDAATLFATNPAWREAFREALEECRQEILNKRAKAMAEADEALKAIGDRYPIEPAGAPPPAKLTKKPMPKKAPLAKVVGGTAVALAAIKLAGKDGIAARTLGKELGTTAGPVVAELIKDKKVRQKGTAGATRYYAI